MPKRNERSGLGTLMHGRSHCERTFITCNVEMIFHDVLSRNDKPLRDHQRQQKLNQTIPLTALSQFENGSPWAPSIHPGKSQQRDRAIVSMCAMETFEGNPSPRSSCVTETIVDGRTDGTSQCSVMKLSSGTGFWRLCSIIAR